MSTEIVSTIKVVIEKFGFAAEATGALGIVAVTIVTVAFIAGMVLIALNTQQ